jgi:hypothetical protein
MKKEAKYKLIQPAIGKILKSIPQFLILSYITFSFLTLTNCTNRHNDDISYDQFVQKNRETARRLVHQNKAELFDCKQIDFILNKTVVADSTVTGTINKNGKYYLKASINNSCGEKIFTMLSCPGKIYDQYNNGRSNHIILAAKITKIEKLNPIAETDSLDGKSVYLSGNTSILLTGECLAFAEIPIYSSLD